MTEKAGTAVPTDRGRIRLDHIAQLDGLRGVAVLMVMWFHFFQNSAARESGPLFAAIDAVTPIGRTGVDLFFVLSGFLITRILMAATDGDRYFLNFYARRSLRILPLYYFFLIATMLVVPLVKGDALAPWSEQWYWWVQLQNLPLTFGWPSQGPDVYWSLAVEEHFYLVWPLLVLLVPRRALAASAGIIVVAAFVIRVAMMRQGWDTYYFTGSRMDTLALGALIAAYERVIRADSATWHRRFLGLLVVAGLPVAAMLATVGGAGDGLLQAVRYSLQAVAYCGVVGAVITAADGSAIISLLRSRLLVFTGAISYGLYVYHRSAYAVVNEQLDSLDLLVRGVAGVALAFAFAYTSSRFIEAPFLRLKRFF